MKKKKQEFYLVHGSSDGWVLHQTKKKAVADYEEIAPSDDGARMIKVTKFEEVKLKGKKK